MKHFAKIVTALGAAALGVILAFAIATKTEIQRGTHLAHVNWLPAEASDVTYAKRDGLGWFVSYECKLPKEAVAPLAQKKGWTLEPKTDVTVGLRSILTPPPPKESAATNGVVVVDLTRGGARTDPISKALFYEKRYSNGGGVTAVYDLDAERLFVYESDR